MNNFRKTVDNKNIIVGDGESLNMTYIGEFHGTYHEDGKTLPIVIKDVGYVPDFTVNLMSLTKMMDKCFSLINIGRKIITET